MGGSASYERGRVDLDAGCHAWLQPDGGWGWSNAGLVVGDGASLLVDTLFDLPLTRDMLDGFAPLTAAAPIGTLVNTHANGDHCYGNELVTGADIVATESCASEMAAVPPSTLAGLMAAARRGSMGPVGDYLLEIFDPFEFEGITLTPPTTTFTDRMTVDVGGTTVELIEVGPAHTAGDLLVHVPEARTVFTGDICFIEGTPIMWAGPVENWLTACDRITDELDVDVVVPGHGPITDAAGVRRMRSYLQFVADEAAARHAAGDDAPTAARSIDLGSYADWIDAERLAVNVDTVFRSIDPAGTDPADIVTLFSRMAELHAAPTPPEGDALG